MAISPLLLWDNGYSGSTPRAHRLLNGTTLENVQLGAATALSATSRDDAADGVLPSNRIIEFQGDLYTYHGGSVYQFVFGSKTWASVHALASPPNNADDNSITGWNIVAVNGELRLYLFYQQSLSTSTRGVYTTDGSVWTPTATTTVNAWPQATIVYQNKIYMCGDRSSIFYRYDPLADTWTTIPQAGTAWANPRTGTFINFRGRLLVIGPQPVTTRAAPIFKELVTGTYIDATFSGGTDPGDMVATPGPAQNVTWFPFEYQNNLYVVGQELTTNFNDAVNDGQMQVWQFVPNGTTPGSSWAESNISSTVVPSDWLTGGAFATAFHSRGALQGYVQIDDDPLNPEVYFWRHRQYGANEDSTFWTWNGPASLMTVVSSSFSNGHSIAQGDNNTGEHVYTEGDYDVTLTNPLISPGKLTFDFQAHTPLDSSSPTNKQGKLYYSIGGSDWTEATFHSDAPTTVSGGDSAPTISANTLQGIVVGNSVFRATWDAVTDGFTGAAEEAELHLRVF